HQQLDRAMLDKTDLRMPRDVVAKREQFLVHQLFGARDDLFARRIGGGQTRRQRRRIERLFKLRHFLQHLTRRLAIDGRLLAAGGRDEKREQRNETRTHETNLHAASRVDWLFVTPGFFRNGRKQEVLKVEAEIGQWRDGNHPLHLLTS